MSRLLFFLLSVYYRVSVLQGIPGEVKNVKGSQFTAEDKEDKTNETVAPEDLEREVVLDISAIKEIPKDDNKTTLTLKKRIMMKEMTQMRKSLLMTTTLGRDLKLPVKKKTWKITWEIMLQK